MAKLHARHVQNTNPYPNFQIKPKKKCANPVCTLDLLNCRNIKLHKQTQVIAILLGTKDKIKINHDCLRKHGSLKIKNVNHIFKLFPPHPDPLLRSPSAEAKTSLTK